MTPPLTTSELADFLNQHPAWHLSERCLRRKFEFRNFVHAFAFMTACALEAEKANHHPDWSNSYNTVDVSLRTHDSGGITQKDTSLAARMSEVAQALGGSTKQASS